MLSPLPCDLLFFLSYFFFQKSFGFLWEPYRLYFYDVKILKGLLEYHFFFKPHPYSLYFFFIISSFTYLFPSLFSLLSSFFFLILLICSLPCRASVVKAVRASRVRPKGAWAERTSKASVRKRACDQRERGRSVRAKRVVRKRACERFPACDQRERADIGALATPHSYILKTITMFDLKIS